MNIRGKLSINDTIITIYFILIHIFLLNIPLPYFRFRAEARSPSEDPHPEIWNWIHVWGVQQVFPRQVQCHQPPGGQALSLSRRVHVLFLPVTI